MKYFRCVTRIKRLLLLLLMLLFRTATGHCLSCCWGSVPLLRCSCYFAEYYCVRVTIVAHIITHSYSLNAQERCDVRDSIPAAMYFCCLVYSMISLS